MKNKYVFVAVMLALILILGLGVAAISVNENNSIETDEDFVVVTSFYPMYIAAMNVIGDAPGVTLKNLSEPQTGCLHDFTLTPEDMKLLSTADVFIINGGGIESFMEEIADAYPDLVIIEASEGIDLLEQESGEGHDHDHEEEKEADDHDGHHHDVNAHVWMSVAKYRAQVANICVGLKETNPANAVEYERNTAEYDEKLVFLQEKQQAVAKALAEREVILFHSAFAYLTKEYGMDVAFCMDLDEERQISAQEVAKTVSLIKEHGVKILLAEAEYGQKMCETIQGEVDVRVLYLDPLNKGDYQADSYLDAMEANISKLQSLLENEGK